MLEPQSPLAGLQAFAGQDITLAEAPGFTLTQVAGEDKELKKVLGKLPASPGVAALANGRVLFRIAPKQVWVIGGAPEPGDRVYLTPLSSSRTRLALEGGRARELLSACTPIDFRRSQIGPGQFVMTGIHHTPVLIHCTGDDSFHIYAMRTFAQAVWEWLVDSAVAFTG